MYKFTSAMDLSMDELQAKWKAQAKQQPTIDSILNEVFTVVNINQTEETVS